MVKEAKIATLLDGLTFPEAPRWHAGRLWFSDFYTCRVLAVDLAGQVEEIANVPQRPSGLGWTPEGDLLVVSMLDRRVLRLRDGSLGELADLSWLATGPCNDMIVDMAGGAYVGNFGFDLHAGEPKRATALARIDPDGHVVRAANNLLFPNGMVITPDGRTLVVAETFANQLTAFDINSDGTLTDRRVFAQMDDCFPDGICLDTEGAIWVADARGAGVMRVFDGGRIDRAISVAPRIVYACMLGGADRHTLFLCTSSGSGPAVAQKRDGRIEFLHVDVPGAGLP
jgi:sugar lactone lactonase YvrE